MQVILEIEVFLNALWEGEILECSYSESPSPNVMSHENVGKITEGTYWANKPNELINARVLMRNE